MAAVWDSTRNLAYSVMTIPERSRRVGYIQTARETISSLKEAVHEPIKALSGVKDSVSGFVTKGVMGGVKVVGLHQCGSRTVARKCAQKFYEHSGAKKAVATTAQSVLSSVTESSFVQNTLGSTGASLLNAAGSLLGESAEELFIKECGDRVFFPVISALQEKVIESRIKGSVDLAIDTTALWAVGGLGIVGNLDKVRQVVTVADKIAAAANVGALVYVYGKPAVRGVQVAAQCCSLKCRMRKIDRALNRIKLQPFMKACGLNISETVVKKSLSGILAVCIESGVVATSMGLDTMLKDEKILTTLVQAVATVTRLN